MKTQGWLLAVYLSLVSVLETGESVTATESQKNTCRTFGSGVVQPFNSSSFYVRSNCPFIFARFTHNQVECEVIIQRGDSGLLVEVEIIINKIRTVLRNGSILVEKKSVSLPYDHMYQHIFHYGIYTKLKSSLLPLSVIWHNVPGGIDTVWMELDQELSTDMTGLCGEQSSEGNMQQLITESVLDEDTCQIRDPVSTVNAVCRHFFSYALSCLQAQTTHYIQLCDENIYGHEESKYIRCAFFKEIVQQCGSNNFVWDMWRSVTECEKPTCPGDLNYVEQGEAFIASCSSPHPSYSNQDLISSCVCPEGKVVDDHSKGYQCVKVSSCGCEFAGKTYSPGDIRTTKCQSCVCDGGKWQCSENLCPSRCSIEGHFVTTFDGKQYVVPGKCSYVASQGPYWIITIEFSSKALSLKKVSLQIFEETYTVTLGMVTVGEEEITDLHQSERVLVFWQSSMYIQVFTIFGMNIQIQMTPEIQLYFSTPGNHTGLISGLCGNNNNDTTDDFTTSYGIVENSPQPFALSWSIGTCVVNIPPTCINTDNEIFADEKCSVLNDPKGIFAKCYAHIPTDYYHMACIQRTCNCGGNLQQCLCAALSSYVKACASLGVLVGDWREASNCTVKCQNNQKFSYDIQSCNHTCRSLSGSDPRCWLVDEPVEGCGCPEGTHMNHGHVCTPKAECNCFFQGGSTPPGLVVMDGQKCSCENGELHCTKDCGCSDGKVCVHCSEAPIPTARKTCDSLSKPKGTGLTCESGCYCPDDKYEDHRGNCVSVNECTCVYSGKVFDAGQSVKTNCKTCVCTLGLWHCKDEPCPGRCQVYGNGHYQTFDSKWYRFDGNCQYTLVEDDCGHRNSTFSISIESVPCCDEALTCSRSITFNLQNKVTLTLSNMRVTSRYPGGGTQEGSLYFIHTVGLYIIISVPSKGITLIWDKHTRVTVELSPHWRNKVCGLCGNFDSNEMNDLQISSSAVMSSPLAFGNSWKAASPPCSDVTAEIFPCERHSYCSAWAERRCMILTGDTFKDCHLKVDPEPYYRACVQESCSCEFEGKFLGFCTAVAAYSQACSVQDVCVNWRTPDLCPVYCDYYNEKGQCSWHYEACGQMLTCGRSNFTHKLEGCYPRCSKDVPYYDENTGECTELRNCTCTYNDTIIHPGAFLWIHSDECRCENGMIHCATPLPTEEPTTTPSTTPSTVPPTTTTPSTTTQTTVPSTTTKPSTTTQTTVPSTTIKPSTTTQTTVPSTTTKPSTTTQTTVPSTTIKPSTTTQTTVPSTTTKPSTTTQTTVPSTTTKPSTTTQTTEPSTTTKPSTTTQTTVPSTTTKPSTTTLTTVPSTTTKPSTTTLTTVPSTTTKPSTTTQTTVPSTTTKPSTTTQTTVPSTTTKPSTTTQTTVPSTTTPPSTTTQTTVPSTTTTPSTTTQTTVPSTTTKPSTTTQTTVPSTTTTLSTTTQTTVPSTTTTPSTTTQTTMPSTTTTPSTTTQTTVPSTTTKPSTTTQTTVPSTTTKPSTTTQTTVPSTTTKPSTTTQTTVPSTTTKPSTTTQTTVPSTTTTPSTTTQTTVPSTTTKPSTTTQTTVPSTTTKPSTTTQTTVPSTTTKPSTTTQTTVPSTTTTPSTTTQTTVPSTTTKPSTTTQTTVPSTTTKPSTTTQTTVPSTTTTSLTTSSPTTFETTVISTTATTSTTAPTTSPTPSTTMTTKGPCECKDIKRKKSWSCNETWEEDCFHKICLDGKIEMTPVVCHEDAIPSCPRGQVTRVSDGCCETWKCDCRCDLYGDPHYITFQGATFDFLDDCTYILVEERTPRHHLTIAVDNFYCVHGLDGSCVKGIILKYQNSTATLNIDPQTFTIQAALNNMTIKPPYQEHGWRFDVTGYIVSIYLPDIRSYVALSPSYNLEIHLAMEHFFNNTQGQCGVCGDGSCIRKGGKIEDDTCCEKTSYDWVYPDPQKPACFSAPKDVPCFGTTVAPPPPPDCPEIQLCELLNHPVFSNCSEHVDLTIKKKSCEFDACRSGPCSSLEQAAVECKTRGFCIDWRKLTNGSCGWNCPKGLIYRECHDKQDDFCYGGVQQPGASFKSSSAGCFCPSGLMRAGNHSDICVPKCPYCKGPLGEPKLPGEKWRSGCHNCTCNNQTLTEECVLRLPKPAPTCGPKAKLESRCCGDLTCVEKTCRYNGTTYQVGDIWRDPDLPCMSFTCDKDGVQTETKVCPTENCAEEDRVWDDQHCCFSCNQSCAPKVTSINITIDNCTTILQMPVCQGQCISQPRVVLHDDLQVEQMYRCCQAQSSERRSVTLQCFDLSARHYTYKHITSCECTACDILKH